MTNRDDARQARFREASAGLAAALAAGDSGVQGGTGPRPPTKQELWLLRAMVAAGGSAVPHELVRENPDRFPGCRRPDGHQVRSAVSSLHQTGASLVKKGWATRGRKQIDRHGDGVKSGGPRNYRITAEGRRICQE